MTDAISAIAAGSNLSDMSSHASSLEQSNQRAIQAAAKLMGLPELEVERMLHSGHSLNQIAEQHGFTRHQLVTAIRGSTRKTMDYYTSTHHAVALANHRVAKPTKN